MVSDKVRELIKNIKKRNFNDSIRDYVFLVCRDDAYVQSMLDYLQEHPDATEDEVIHQIFVIVPPQLFFIGDLTKENYIKYKTHYIQDWIELFDKNGNIASKELQNWAHRFLFDCTLDKEWEDSSNGVVVLELRDVVWFYNKCNNKAVIEIIDTDDINDITPFFDKALSLIMVNAKNDVPFENFSIFQEQKNISTIHINNNIKQKYQIGILYPLADK